MVLRILNLTQWEPLTDRALVLPAGRGRTVRVEVNCPVVTRFDLAVDNQHFFLAAGVLGRETLEFAVPRGAREIAVVWFGEEAPWYRTEDGNSYAIHRPEAVTFTTLWERAARDPVREALMWEARQNAERLQASLDEQRRAMRAEMEAFKAEHAKPAPAPAPAPEVEVDDDDESAAESATGAAEAVVPASGGGVQQVAARGSAKAGKGAMSVA